MSWKKLLESVSESLRDHLQFRNDDLLAENRILRNQIDGRVQLTDSERKELAEIGAKPGKKALTEIATVAQPDTILAWNRKFSGLQVDTSESSKPVGRPRVDQEIEHLVLRMARENRSWGYDRIQGALQHLGYTIRDQTVGNILKRHGVSPAPERKKTVTRREFVRFHLDVLRATDFFNSEIWSWFGLMISCLIGFIHFVRHHIHSVGMTLYHHVRWIRSFLLPSRGVNALVQIGRRVVETSVRSQLLLLDAWFFRVPLSACTTEAHRVPVPHGMRKVVRMPAVSPRPIPDGPLRLPRGGLLKDGDREAA